MSSSKALFDETSIAPVIITGAAQRVGLALAHHLIDKGQPVVITYRTQRPGVEELSARAVACIPADFATKQGVDDFIHSIKDRFPRIRALIHNASDWVAEGKTADTALFQSMMQVHALAPYTMNIEFRELLERNADSGEKADIIHFTDYIVETGSKKHIAYAASKAALANLALSFSSLLAPKVKVNSIAPAMLEFNQGDSEEYKNKVIQKSLMHTVPGFTEAVAAVDFILNSGYITGRTIALDGGRHLK